LAEALLQIVDPLEKVEVESTRVDALVALYQLLRPVRRPERRVVDDPGQPVVPHHDRDARIEAQQAEVGKVVGRQPLTREVGVDEAQPPKAACPTPHSLEVRKLDTDRVANCHVLDTARP
jgi:hypothetical protein